MKDVHAGVQETRVDYLPAEFSSDGTPYFEGRIVSLAVAFSFTRVRVCVCVCVCVMIWWTGLAPWGFLNSLFQVAVYLPSC